MKKKIALITGITGQDGAYLAKFLIKKNYIVHGIKRRSSLINTQRVDDIYKDKHFKKINFFLHYGDVTDGSNINQLISKIKPNEIYNLAAQSHVQVSFQTPFITFTNAIGTLNILESIKSNKLEKFTKFYQALRQKCLEIQMPKQFLKNHLNLLALMLLQTILLLADKKL